eukprot:COSAG05_NODE_1656_length_4329_cov_15.816548_4_plen_233_part_00
MPKLLGADGEMMGHFWRDPIASIRQEFQKKGVDPQHRRNFDNVFDGSGGKTLEELLQHPHAQKAKLETHHILALRLYTTSSYSCINEPLRKDPPPQPHPFAATTFWISEGIKMLRAVHADAGEKKVYWRGIDNMGLSKRFVEEGGTEFACVSTSAARDVALAFANSKLPLVFKFESTDFTSRGADVSFLSVYPAEQEVLYPPLTYLRSMGEPELQDVGSQQILVVTVQPEMM